MRLKTRPMTPELTPEQLRAAQLDKIQERAEAGLAQYKDERRWFNDLKLEYKPVLNEAVEDALKDNPDGLTERELRENIASFAKADFDNHNFEITSKLTVTTIIGTVATILLAAFTLKIVGGIPGLLMILAAGLNGAAFIRALIPLAPPYKRSKKPYIPGHIFSVLPYDSTGRYAVYSYLRDRRSPIIQRYKRAHAVVVRLLIAAAVCVMLALTWTQVAAFFTK